MSNNYKYYKNYGIEKKKKKPIKYTSPASERWAKMSLFDLTKELDRLGLKYPEAQLMAQNGTLPEEFGLGCVLR